MSSPKAASVTKLYQNGSIWPRCTRTPFVFVSSTIEPVKGFSHHVQLRLAVPLEHAGIALPKHQGDEVVGYTARAEPCGERVTQLVQGEIGNPGTTQRCAPDLLWTAQVRLGPTLGGAGKQVVGAGCRLRHGHVSNSVLRFGIGDVDKLVFQVHLRLEHRQ